MSDSQITAEMRLDEYGTVLVDEAHLLDKETLENIVEAAENDQLFLPAIVRISYRQKKWIKA